MTEPVARAASPRCTVRVAVALVAGQAALCAVIGWVTFGPSEPAPQAARVSPLSEPIVVPTVSIGLPTLQVPPAPPDVSASRAPVSASPRASRSSKPPTSRATSRPPAGTPRPIMATEESPAVPPAPNPEVAATPPPTPIEEVQAPVVEGTPCDPEGARGRTVEEVDLRCVRDADGDLVWQIN